MNPLRWLIQALSAPHAERRELAEKLAETEIAHQKELSHAQQTRRFIEISDARVNGLMDKRRRRR